MEARANENPGNSYLQTQLYEQLLRNGEYEKISRRVDSLNYALDTQGAKIYVEALNRSGQGERALQFVVNGLSSSGNAGLARSVPHYSYPRHNESFMKSAKDLNSNIGPIKQSNFSSEFATSAKSPNAASASETSAGSKTNPLHVISQPAPVKPRDRLWQTVRFAALIYLGLAVISTYSEEIGKATGRSFSAANEMDPHLASKDKKVTFADVQGVDEAKDELQEIVEFLKDPAKFTRLGGKLPKGVLLTGPPGTGKTLLARAIAGEAEVPFFHCSGSEFDEMFVGVGAKRVRELFSAAKKRSPCIVFIDEIDAVGSMRNPKDQQFAKMTLNQLLVEMDGFSQTQGIIVIGATNFPESLDRALVRPGRFDRNVVVSVPDVRGRLAILKCHTKSVPLSEDVKLDLIARGTPGFSGADLANLVNHAALRAASTSQTEVNMNDLDWAKDRILMGAEKKNAVISERNRKIVAYHEAGHAIMALFTPGANTIHKATIMPRGQALGMVSQLPQEDEMEWTKKQLVASLDVCMGGRVSEEYFFGAEEITGGASSDLEKATRIARSMVMRLGMGSQEVGQVMMAKNQEDYAALSSETRLAIEKDVKRLLDDSYSRTGKLLKEKKHELEMLAEALLTHETLSRTEIETIVAGGSLNKPLDPSSPTSQPNVPKDGSLEEPDGEKRRQKPVGLVIN